jgi:rhodanese-related sulfurtransferase
MSIRWEAMSNSGPAPRWPVLLGVIILTSHSVAGNRPEGLAKAAATGEALIQPETLGAFLAQETPLLVVDLRDAASFGQYHIPGAKNLAVLELASTQLAQETPVIVCSDDGALAGQAWAVLASRGVDARVLEGGMRQWIEVAGPPELRASGAAAPANGAGVGSVHTPAGSAAMPAVPPVMGRVKRFKKGSSCS